MEISTLQAYCRKRVRRATGEKQLLKNQFLALSCVDNLQEKLENKEITQVYTDKVHQKRRCSKA